MVVILKSSGASLGNNREKALLTGTRPVDSTANRSEPQICEQTIEEKLKPQGVKHKRKGPDWKGLCWWKGIFVIFET
jgi:hypothetical protein